MAESENIQTVDHKPHAAFFRQSGWLMISTIAGGMFMAGVHVLSKFVDAKEYAAFGTLLMVVACLPTMPLQMMFVQQTALSLATGQERRLSRLVRQVCGWIFILWLTVAVLVLVFQKQIAAGWHLPGTGGLLVTLPLILLSILTPVFGGVLQGRQDFFWMGWSAIIAGVLRVAGAALLVLALALGATGMMVGALLSVAAGVGIAMWRTRDLWSLSGGQSDWTALSRQVVPLLFGFGACQFMFTSDTMFAKAYFSDDQMAPYIVVGTLSRSLLWLVLPMASVMFPKLVQANAKSEKTNLFMVVVLGTAVLAICGGLGLCLTGPLVVKFISKPDYVSEAVKLFPWYAAAMVPLALANVMVNDLLARGRFAVVPFMVLLAAAYGFTLPAMLNHFPGRLEVVLQTLGAFNLLLFAVCAVFTWGVKGK
jgi:O-antigen/teichoic acid export membrane protein